MIAVVRVVAGLLIGSVIVAACASSERPEVVPGSTIATSTTSTSTTSPDPLAGSHTDGGPSDPDPTRSTIGPTTSFEFLDPDDPNYPTTVPPPPRPSVSYPTSG